MPDQEVQIYTWKDATLGEILELLGDAIPQLNDKNASAIVSLVYPDRNGLYVLKQVLVQ